jgi:hypothetical protein
MLCWQVVNPYPCTIVAAGGIQTTEEL